MGEHWTGASIEDAAIQSTHAWLISHNYSRLGQIAVGLVPAKVHCLCHYRSRTLLHSTDSPDGPRLVSWHNWWRSWTTRQLSPRKRGGPSLERDICRATEQVNAVISPRVTYDTECAIYECASRSE